MTWRLASLAVAVVVACSGGSPPKVRAPSTDASSASLRRGSFGSLLARASVSVTNSNPFAIELLTVDWELSIDGGEPVRGRSAYRVPVGAGETAPVDIVIRLAPADAGPLTARMIGGAGKVLITGRLYFESDRGPVSTTFSVER